MDWIDKTAAFVWGVPFVAIILTVVAFCLMGFGAAQVAAHGFDSFPDIKGKRLRYVAWIAVGILGFLVFERHPNDVRNRAAGEQLLTLVSAWNGGDRLSVLRWLESARESDWEENVPAVDEPRL